MTVTSITDPAYRAALERLAGVRVPAARRDGAWRLAESLAGGRPVTVRHLQVAARLAETPRPLGFRARRGCGGRCGSRSRV